MSKTRKYDRRDAQEVQERGGKPHLCKLIAGARRGVAGPLLPEDGHA